MTITQEAIDTKFTNAFNADKPCFIVKNILTGNGYSGQQNKWYRQAGGAITPPDFTSAGSATLADNSVLPIRYTYDNRSSVFSSPDSTQANGDTEFWALYAAKWETLIGASYSEYTQDWYADAVVIKAHGYGQGSEGMSGGLPANTIDLQMELSATNNFASTWDILNDAVYGDDTDSNRHPSKTGVSRTNSELIPATGNYRYKINGDAFFRLFFQMKVGVTPTFVTAPKIGEVFVGERIQMSRNQNQPYMTELSYADGTTNFESNNGDIVRYVRHKGQRRFELTFSPTGDDSYGIDDVEQIKLLAKKTNQFTEPFMYVPKPSSEPNNAYFVMTESADFNLEAVGPFERSVTLTLVELPPYVAYEVGL
mgnify:CR=1 FL=1|tara:strand:+ start:981 stop:2081 length:1101 start_codon:yes stop_codon:yes gene_type:complete